MNAFLRMQKTVNGGSTVWYSMSLFEFMHAKTDHYPKLMCKVRKALHCHCLDFVARQRTANWAGSQITVTQLISSRTFLLAKSVLAHLIILKWSAQTDLGNIPVTRLLSQTGQDLSQRPSEALLTACGCCCCWSCLMVFLACSS